jgi:hypothetical protein
MRDLEPADFDALLNRTTPSFLNAKVFRDAGITLALSFVGGLVIGFTTAYFRLQIEEESSVAFVGLSNIACTVLGGFIAGLRTPPAHLLRHLSAVGLIIWLFGLVNIALGFIDFEGFLLTAFVIAPSLALGGWLSQVFNRAKS